MNKETAVLYSVENNIAIIKMNQANSMNSLTDDLVSGLFEAFEQAEKDSSVKVVILTGAGNAFCAGGDITAFSRGMNAPQTHDYMENLHNLINKYIKLPKPTIGAINGFATGAGLSIAMLNDIIISASSAKYGSAFLNVGIAPDLAALYYLPRIIGLPRAKELVFTNDIISAQTAFEWGLGNYVVPDEELLPKALEMANKIKRSPVFATKLSKNLLNASIDLPLNEVVHMEKYAQSLALLGPDAKEGATAFLEKRRPNFD